MSSQVPGHPRHHQSPGDIANDLKELPSVAEILPKLLKILEDSSATLQDVVALIKVEPGIAARVLQIGNSAYYSHGGPSASLEDGVHRIGFLKIYEVVSYAVSSQILLRRLATYDMEPTELWMRSVGCAIVSSMLAAGCEFDVDAAYTTGLFHAVGLVAIDSWIASQPPQPALQYADFRKEATKTERHFVGFSNTAIGAALLRNWNFKPSVCEAVYWQDSPKSAGPHRRAACILNAARWLQAEARQAGGGPILSRPEPWVFKEIQLPEGDVDKRIAEAAEEIARASRMIEEDPPAGDGSRG
jgi:HD-like signal output (HDOD) protein